MRAAVRRTYGGPVAVEFDEVPKPVPEAGEIVVRVHATTVNRTDCAYRSGKPWINRLVCGLPRPKVQVLGSEFAGVVHQVGAEVEGYAVGDRVFGFVDGRPGAHAEFVAVDTKGLVATLPEGWSLTDAAPGMEGAHYAQACLRVTDLRAGDRVLVHGASGSIGSALVQLLHAERIAVTAACDQRPPALEEQLAHLEGVEWVPSQAQGPLPRVQFHAVIDATGHFPFGRARSLIRPGGTYISSDLGRGGQNSCSLRSVRWYGGSGAGMRGSRSRMPTRRSPHTWRT